MRTDWQVVLAYEGEEVAGAWPYFPQKKWGVSLWRNPPLTPYLGPQIFVPSGLSSQKEAHFRHRISEELITRLTPLPAVCLIGLEPSFKGAGLLQRAGFEIGSRQTFLLDLQKTPQELLHATRENVRRQLRKTAQELQIVKAPTQAGLLWKGQQKTLQRKVAGSPAHDLGTLERAVTA